VEFLFPTRRTGTVDYRTLPNDVYLVDLDHNRIQKKKGVAGQTFILACPNPWLIIILRVLYLFKLPRSPADPDAAPMPPLPAQAQLLDRLQQVASHLLVRNYTCMSRRSPNPRERRERKCL
jgi:hypothetical protein